MAYRQRSNGQSNGPGFSCTDAALVYSTSQLLKEFSMSDVRAYAAQSSTSGVAPFAIDRRELRPDDVDIAIEFCGICHTDIHFVNNDWGATVYPVVPRS